MKAKAYIVLSIDPEAVSTAPRPRAFGRGILGKAEALRRKAWLEDMYPDLLILALPHDKAVELYDVYV